MKSIYILYLVLEKYFHSHIRLLNDSQQPIILI